MTQQLKLSALLLGALFCTGALAADQEPAPKAATHLQKVREALAALGATPADTTPVGDAHEQPAHATEQ